MSRLVGIAGLIALLTTSQVHATPAKWEGFVSEFEAATTVVVLMETNPPSTGRVVLKDGSEADFASFRVVEVLKGTGLKAGTELKLLGTPLKPQGRYWYAEGKNVWPHARPLDQPQAAFVQRLAKLPKKGNERLAFFQEFLDSTEGLEGEALGEFDRASWEELRAFKPGMNRERALARLKDPEVSHSFKRVSLKLLAVCGTPADAPMLEKMLLSDDRELLPVQQAVVTAYVSLRGVEGLELADRLLADPKTALSRWSFVVQGLRDVAAGAATLPRERLIRSFRLGLDRRHCEDLVVMDLARLEDWDSMDRLVKLFRESKDASFVRVPVLRFLMACPRPEAQAHLEEFRKLAPEDFEKARVIEAIQGKEKAGQK